MTEFKCDFLGLVIGEVVILVVALGFAYLIFRSALK